MVSDLEVADVLRIRTRILGHSSRYISFGWELYMYVNLFKDICLGLELGYCT